MQIGLRKLKCPVLHAVLSRSPERCGAPRHVHINRPHLPPFLSLCPFIHSLLARLQICHSAYPSSYPEVHPLFPWLSPHHILGSSTPNSGPRFSTQVMLPRTWLFRSSDNPTQRLLGGGLSTQVFGTLDPSLEICVFYCKSFFSVSGGGRHQAVPFLAPRVVDRG